MTPRPAVLAYPSPTSSQFLVFIAAMLAAGAFVGAWLHNEIAGDDWERQVAACIAPEGARSPGDALGLERGAREQRCRAPAERRRAAYAFGGAAAAGVAGLLVLLVAPAVVRRRRALRPLPGGLSGAAERLGTLATEAGVDRAPALVLGGARQRDAFAFGLPRRYAIALPPAVAVRYRDGALFDPVIRHELAHVRHRDVALAWLARSIWYALAPLLALPVVEGIAAGDLSLIPVYAWRAALLALAVQLVASALLRSREIDADLRAAAAGGHEAIMAVVARTRGEAERPWHRRPFARHPSPAERLAVLERPELAVRVGFRDGFTPAFLAGLSVPLAMSALSALLTGAGFDGVVEAAVACLLAPLLAGSVGLGLGRAALVGRVTGHRPRAVRPALGVAVGLVLGQLASLGQVGAESLLDIGPTWWLAATAVLGFGGTVLAAGLAELWADAAPALPTARRSWIPLLVTQTALLAAVLWFVTSLEIAARTGWAMTQMWLTYASGSALALVAVAVTAASAAWALWTGRRPGRTPAWLLERGEPAAWPGAGRLTLRVALTGGVLAGAAGGAGLVLFRLVAGRPESDLAALDRFNLVVWVAAAAAGAAALALLLGRPGRGAGAALLAAPLACRVTVSGVIGLTLALGGSLTLAFLESMTRSPLALALLVVVLLAPVAVLAGRALPVWPAALAAGALATAALVLARGTLVPSSSAAPEQAAAAALERSGQEVNDALAAPGKRYAAFVAPDLYQDFAAVDAARAALAENGKPAPGRVRRELVAPLRAMLADARAVQARGPAASVHEECLRALEGYVGAWSELAAVMAAEKELGPARVKRRLARVNTEVVQANTHWQAWQTGVLALASAG